MLATSGIDFFWEHVVNGCDPKRMGVNLFRESTRQVLQSSG
jgi:hypothetical protein